jgi:hypothetical protein
MAIKPVSSKQYRALLAELDMTQVGTARALGVNDVTSRRWAASGAVGIAALVLRLLMAGKLTIADIEAVARE